MELLLTTDDARALDVEVAGPAGAPVVLVHHGSPQGRRLPTAYVQAAERLGLRLVTWARPGYGRSSRRPGRTVADVTDDALAVADLVGAERFATVGASGGGPHALALGARAPRRCVAVATLAGVGPYGDPTLDWLEGMGEGNVAEFGAVLEGEQALRALLERELEAMTGAGVAGMVDAMRSVLSPPDRAVLTDRVGEEFFAGMQAALAPGVDGWLDDDLAFVGSWGFSPEDVTVPVHVWQGEQDLMVPPAHGRWLAERLPAAQAHLLPDDGHLTLLVVRIEQVLSELAEALR